MKRMQRAEFDELKKWEDAWWQREMKDISERTATEERERMRGPRTG
jgi:hypothetical protein